MLGYIVLIIVVSVAVYDCYISSFTACKSCGKHAVNLKLIYIGMDFGDKPFIYVDSMRHCRSCGNVTPKQHHRLRWWYK